jgi:hypothetical protein
MRFRDLWMMDERSGTNVCNVSACLYASIRTQWHKCTHDTHECARTFSLSLTHSLTQVPSHRIEANDVVSESK